MLDPKPAEADVIVSLLLTNAAVAFPPNWAVISPAMVAWLWPLAATRLMVWAAAPSILTVNWLAVEVSTLAAMAVPCS